MSTHASAQAFTIGQAAPIILWAIRHASDLPDIRAAFNVVGTVQDLQPKWQAWKASGDLVVAALADFPGINDFVNKWGSHTFSVESLGTDAFTTAAIQKVAESNGLAIGDGTIIRIVFENLPAILAAIAQLVNLFKGV